MTVARPISISRRRNLPQWQAEEGTYFVTFRLFDSLTTDLARLRGGKGVEEALDRGFGSCHLANPAVGDMVFAALRFFDGWRYVLHAAVVMPNHVHVVFRTAPRITLAAVMRSLKSYTARRANMLLGRHGPFWQEESFSRLIRDVAELERATAYVLANPEKAGLRGWRWVGKFDSTFVAKYHPV